MFDSAGCRPHCLVSRGSLGFVFAAACSKRVFQRIERNRERGRVRVFRRRPGASVTRLRFCISEQIFPKLPESSFGRESVRELIAFIADVVSLGCRVGRCARRAAARVRGESTHL